MYCCTPKALYNHVGGSLLNHHQTIYYVLDLFRSLKNMQRTRGKPVTSRWCANDEAVARTDNMSPLTVFSSQSVALIYFLCSLALTGCDRKRELSSFLTSTLLYWAHLFSGMSAIAVERLNEKRGREKKQREGIFLSSSIPKRQTEKSVHWIEHSYRVCECCGRAAMLLIFGCNYSFFCRNISHYSGQTYNWFHNESNNLILCARSAMALDVGALPIRLLAQTIQAILKLNIISNNEHI